MLTLPAYHHRRAWLRAFGLAAGGLAGLSCGLGILASGLPHAAGIGTLVGLALALPSLIVPRWFSLPYRAWNRLARLFVRGARAYLTRICLYTVFPAAGLTRTGIQLARPADGSSGWVARETLPRDAYGGPSDRPGPQDSTWSSHYARWARQSGTPWAICLLPFLWTLQALEEDVEQAEVSSDVYTLF